MTERTCSATVFGPRVRSWGCTRRGVIQRGGKWYCRQHDPEAVKARKNMRDAAWKRQRLEEDAIYDDALALAQKLGAGEPYYRHGVGGRMGAWDRSLVLTFEEIGALIKRLKNVTDGD